MIKEFSVEHGYEKHLFQVIWILSFSVSDFLRNLLLMVMDTLDEWCLIFVLSLVVCNLETKRWVILNPVEPIAPSFGGRTNCQDSLRMASEISRGELIVFGNFVIICFPDGGFCSK